MPRSNDVILAFFIVSVSKSENFGCFLYLFLHFRRPPSLKLVFDVAEIDKRFGRIQSQRSQKSAPKKDIGRGEYSSAERE